MAVNSTNHTRENEGSGAAITLRGVLLGALTVTLTVIYVVAFARKQGSGTYIHSQYPMAAFLPFVVWLLLNLPLKAFCPRFALRRGELLTIFSMTWIAGVVPDWIWRWAGTMTAPIHFATPENRWAETFFDVLPWQIFPETTSRVVDTFFYGLPEGMAIPWDGWYPQIFNWLGISGAVVTFCFCILILLQRQWQEAEKLAFPLAQLPVDLTGGVDGRGRIPKLFSSRLFWAGWMVPFLPQLYNLVTYFTPGLPEFWLVNDWKYFFFVDDMILVSVRIMPLMLMVVYLCPLDILGSMLLFHGVATAKRYLMDRFGAPGFGLVGYSGEHQFSEAGMVLNTESHGAMVFLALWSIWIARRHLKRVWHQVRTGTGHPNEARLYRFAVVGLLVSGTYATVWAVSIGVSLLMAIATMILMTISFLVTVKLVAASGCAYIFPNRPFLKGETFVLELIGSTYISPERLVPYKMFTSYALLGRFIIPVLPAIPHHLRIFAARRQPGWVLLTVLVAFLVAFGVAVWASLDLAYTEGRDYGDRRDFFTGVSYLAENPIAPNIGKWILWLIGFGEGAVITLLRARFHWFPIHPIGLIFQYTHATFHYWNNFFIVFVIKLILLRYGGVNAYVAGKPFFYGLGVGYTVGVLLSTIVDAIWFPMAGHHVHGW